MYRAVWGRVFGRPTNFSWIVNGELAGSGRPTTERELRWMRSRGVDVVISLTEDPLPEGWIKAAGLEYIHIPIQDHEAPSKETVDKAVDFIENSIARGRAVAVHCAAGQGRTGTILAAYFIKHKGMAAEEAVKLVRRLRPFSIERRQEEALKRYCEEVRSGSRAR